MDNNWIVNEVCLTACALRNIKWGLRIYDDFTTEDINKCVQVYTIFGNIQKLFNDVVVFKIESLLKF